MKTNHGCQVQYFAIVIIATTILGTEACPYLGYKPGSDAENPHITLRAKVFRTKESGCDGAKMHDGRSLQFDDRLAGTQEEAIKDAKGWIGDIIDDEDNLGPKFV
jgi:hypothetical protein